LFNKLAANLWGFCYASKFQGWTKGGQGENNKEEIPRLKQKQSSNTNNLVI